MVNLTYPIVVLKEKIGTTCPSLSNYGDTRCLLKQHLICQVDPVALLVGSHIGWVCFLDCPSHCLVATPGTHHSATTSYLSVSVIHELYFSGKPSHRTNISLVPLSRLHLCKTFSMRYCCLKIPVAPVDTSCLSHLHRCSPPTYICGALSLF